MFLLSSISAADVANVCVGLEAPQALLVWWLCLNDGYWWASCVHHQLLQAWCNSLTVCSGGKSGD